MQDYLNAGISIARKLTPSIWVSGLRTMANNGQTGSTHHFGRSSGTLHRVYALGFAPNAMLPQQKVSIGVKYFHEFDCRSTYQGYTLQISGAVTF